MADTLPLDQLTAKGKMNAKGLAEGVGSVELAIDPNPLEGELDKTSDPDPGALPIHRVLQNAPNKRQKRENYRNAHKDAGVAELPKKKFYRQRAHANPFSDHQLT